MADTVGLVSFERRASSVREIRSPRRTRSRMIERLTSRMARLSPLPSMKRGRASLSAHAEQHFGGQLIEALELEAGGAQRGQVEALPLEDVRGLGAVDEVSIAGDTL